MWSNTHFTRSTIMTYSLLITYIVELYILPNDTCWLKNNSNYKKKNKNIRKQVLYSRTYVYLANARMRTCSSRYVCIKHIAVYANYGLVQKIMMEPTGSYSNCFFGTKSSSLNEYNFRKDRVKTLRGNSTFLWTVLLYKSRREMTVYYTKMSDGFRGLANSSKYKVLGQFAVYQCAFMYSDIVSLQRLYYLKTLLFSHPAINGVIFIDRIDRITSQVDWTKINFILISF